MNRLLHIVSALSLGIASCSACGGNLSERPSAGLRGSRGVSEARMAPRYQGSPSEQGAAPQGLPRANEGSPVGINLTVPNYYSESWPFVNVIKHGVWISGRPQHPNVDKRWDDGAPLALDERGDVARLSPGQVARLYVFSEGTHYHPGLHTVLYEGTGRIEYRGGATAFTRSAGRDSFELPPGQALWIELVETDPSDPVRAIRLLPPGGSCATDEARFCEDDLRCGDARCVPFTESYEARPFHPEFLADLQSFGVLRGLDWLRTNLPKAPPDSPPVRPYPDSFAAWTKPGDATYSPVPFETLIDLSNTLGADLWLPVPSRFDDTDVEALAQLVKARLAPARRVYIEHSNEVWNTLFGQHFEVAAAECARQAEDPRAECDPDGDGVLCEPEASGEVASRCYEYARDGHARRTAQIARIFARVFGAERERRVVSVLAWQVGMLRYHGRPLLELKVDGVPVRDSVDMVAVAPYIGGSEAVMPPADAFFAVTSEPMDEQPAGTFRLLVGDTEGSSRSVLRMLREDARFLRAPPYDHIELGAYEGGLHLFTWEPGQGAAIASLNSDPRVLGLYEQYLSRIRDITGGTVFVHYASPGLWWDHGAFGTKRYQGQDLRETPKHAALEAFVREHRGP